MDKDQIEVLEGAQSARLVAEAHGYDATAEVLGEIVEVLAHSFARTDPAHYPTRPLRNAPNSANCEESFQVAL